MPVNGTTRDTIERARARIAAGRVQIDDIKKSAKTITPELEQTANDMERTVESLLDAVDDIIPDEGTWGFAMRFTRRMLSREMIISIVAIVAIWAGGLESQEAIAVAVAGGGLALGRGVAKQKSGGTDA